MVDGDENRAIRRQEVPGEKQTGIYQRAPFRVEASAGLGVRHEPTAAFIVFAARPLVCIGIRGKSFLYTKSCLVLYGGSITTLSLIQTEKPSPAHKC